MNRRLIVTADDLGLHRGMNQGAVEAHRHGIVTACSLVANGREFDHGVELLRSTPSLEVGVHLTLVAEKPLTAGLSFPRSWREFAIRYLARQLDFAALGRELRAQVHKVLATGLRVTHLNSHQHLHALPSVRKIVRQIADEHDIHFVRVPLDRGGSGRRLAMRLLGRMAQRMERRFQTIGIADAGHLSRDRLIRLFDEVNETPTELVTHPGRGDIARAYDWGYEWEKETDALCDPGVRAALDERQIVLTTPSKVTDASRA